MKRCEMSFLLRTAALHLLTLYLTGREITAALFAMSCSIYPIYVDMPMRNVSYILTAGAGKPDSIHGFLVNERKV
jgi:hypothetical protein